MREPRFLNIDQTLALHDMQIHMFGGAGGVRDIGLLSSALGNAEATFGGQFLHQTLFEMAAAYLCGICLNHPFVDGNKRTAVHAALTFLDLNGIDVTATEDDFYDMVIGVAEGRVSKAAVAVFFETHHERT